MEQYSPKSSPRSVPGATPGPSSSSAGTPTPTPSPVPPPPPSRSQESTASTSGTLKTTICLGKTPSIVHTGPFYLMKELPTPSERTGASNLMALHNLEHAYNKCSGKKVKDQLSSFLPHLPGVIDTQGSQDGSSLRSVIEKHRMVPKELVPLNPAQLAGFRLHAGPLPEQYRFMTQSPTKNKKHKQKKKKYRGGSSSGGGDSTPELPHITEPAVELPSGASDVDIPNLLRPKHKKTKKHGDEEKRKKKKEKKKKKQKNEDPPSAPGPSGMPSMPSPSMSMPGLM